MTSTLQFTAAAITIGSCILAVTGCAKNTREGSGISACETSLQARLAAPATYRRLWANFTPRGAISIEEVRGKLQRNIAEEEARFASLTDAERLALAYAKRDPEMSPERVHQRVYAGQPDTGFALLEYQATNPAGVPLRRYHFCRLSQPQGQSFSKGNVFFEGEVTLAEGDRAKASYGSTKQ